jgi:hypothetical protein
LVEGLPLVLSNYFYPTNFGRSFAVKTFMPSYEIVEYLIAFEG